MDDDALIAWTSDLLWTVRECLKGRDVGPVLATAYSNLKAVDVDRLDRIVAAKADGLYEPVTYFSASRYVTKMDGDAIAYEARIVAPMPSSELEKIQKRAKSRLRAMSSKNNVVAAITRRNDLTRHWNDVLSYVDGTISNYTKRDWRSRLDRSAHKIDGLYVLLRNSHSGVNEIIKYRNSVAISAGVLS